METAVIIFLIVCVIFVGGFLAKLIFFKHNAVIPLNELDRKSLYEIKQN